MPPSSAESCAESKLWAKSQPLPAPEGRLICRGFSPGEGGGGGGGDVHAFSFSLAEAAEGSPRRATFFNHTRKRGLEGRRGSQGCATTWLEAAPPGSVSSALFPGTLGCLATFKALSGSQS